LPAGMAVLLASLASVMPALRPVSWTHVVTRHAHVLLSEPKIG
jgi:hypothetical protein